MAAAQARQVRLAGMLADQKRAGDVRVFPGHRRNRRRDHFKPMQELMTGADVGTGMEYPRMPDVRPERARILTVIDRLHPEDAPHYWRDYDLLFLDDCAANEDALTDSPEVFAPVPPMAQLRAMAAAPVDGAMALRAPRSEPTGMRQSKLIAILVVIGTVVVLTAKASGQF
jgi:hypothetical protein